MEKAFLLSHVYRHEILYKLVYAFTLQEAIAKLSEELDKQYLSMYGWKNMEHNISSKTI